MSKLLQIPARYGYGLIKPPYNRIHPVSPCVWYPMHEGTGTTLTERLGRGSSVTPVTGSGSSMWGSPPYMSADGTTVWKAQMTFGDYLHNLIRFDQSFTQMLISFDMNFVTPLSSVNAFVGIGGYYSSNGGFKIAMNPSSQFYYAIRGVNGSAATSTNTAALSSPSGKRYAVTYEIIQPTANTIQATVYINGQSFQTMTALDWTTNGGTPYGSAAMTTQNNQFCIGGTASGAGSGTDFLNTGLTTFLFGNLTIMRRTATYDPGLALRVNQDQYFRQTEFPASLNGV